MALGRCFVCDVALEEERCFCVEIAVKGSYLGLNMRLQVLQHICSVFE
jgi:hypothetical protein